MRSKLNGTFKRVIAGVSALCTAFTYSSYGSFGYFNRVNAVDATLYGDFNCDGVVDQKDVSELTKYLKDPSSVKATDEGLANADAFYPGQALDYDDAQVILESLTGRRKLWTTDIDRSVLPVIYGDADCDGDVDFNDAEAVIRYLNDKEENPLTAEGLINADVFYPGQVLDYDDAHSIIENLAGIRNLWTTDLDRSVQPVIYGDTDCDGDVDYDDVKSLLKYLEDSKTNPLTPDGLRNADVYYPGQVLDYEDAHSIIENLAGFRKLWTTDLEKRVQSVIYGDADCDGDVDYDDVKSLLKYLEDSKTNPLTPDGIRNADVYYPGQVLDYEDAHSIIENLAGFRKLWTNDLEKRVQPVIYGDVDCDGDVDFDDVDVLDKYLNDSKKNPLTPDGIRNADVYYPGIEFDYNDANAIIQYLAGVGKLWTTDVVIGTYNTILEDAVSPGDFNCDNVVDIVDALLLNSYLYGKTEYQPSDQALKNANVFNPKSEDLDIKDVAAIAEYVAEKNTLPAEKLATVDSEHLAGDFNCDNSVDIIDLSMLYNYVTGLSDYQPSAQGLINANVYKKDSTEVDIDDLQVLAEFFANKNELNSDKFVTKDSEHLAGDFNCDNTVDIIDLSMLYNYITGVSEYQPSAQGLVNVNVYKKDSTKVDIDDLQVLAEFFAKKNELNSDKLVTEDSEHIIGDFNCDNAVNITDLTMLFNYVYGLSEYQPSAQGLENANVYGKDSTDLDVNDLQALTEFFAKKNDLPTEELAPSEYIPVHGDFNCDNKFDILDAVMYHKYMEGLSDYVPSEQGKKNANVSGSDKLLNYDDLFIMTKMLDPKAKEVISLTDLNGDVNKDGSVNAADLVYLRNVLLGSEKYLETCDVNSDGSFGARDFVLLKMLIVQPPAAEE